MYNIKLELEYRYLQGGIPSLLISPLIFRSRPELSSGQQSVSPSPRLPSFVLMH